MQDFSTPPQPDRPSTSSTQPNNPDALTWATLCHLSALARLVFPFGNLLGPFIIWLLKKNEFPLVDEQGKESLNFQILVTIALLIASLTLFLCVGIVLVPAVALAAVIFVIIASIKVSNGEQYRYPIIWRIIK